MKCNKLKIDWYSPLVKDKLLYIAHDLEEWILIVVDAFERGRITVKQKNKLLT